MDSNQCANVVCNQTILSLLWQLVGAIVFILLALWFASVLLEPLRILGITTIPPGIKYVPYDARF